MPTYLESNVHYPYVWADNVRASGAAFPAVGLSLLLLRLNVRRLQNTRLGLDDITAIIALVGRNWRYNLESLGYSLLTWNSFVLPAWAPCLFLVILYS